jgi:hypothetical protein
MEYAQIVVLESVDHRLVIEQESSEKIEVNQRWPKLNLGATLTKFGLWLQ